MPNAMTTVAQGADAFITIPSFSINAGTNTDVSGIELDVEPLSGSSAGFVNLLGTTATNVTALRINTATQTLQWRYSSTVYLESAAGSAPLTERHKYGAEWDESTLSLYLTKDGQRIAGPYVAPSAGSLITNINWNQIGKVGATAPGGAMAFNLYGVRTYGGNCTYQAQWDETGALGTTTTWADDSATRNLTMTNATGAADSWWLYYAAGVYVRAMLQKLGIISQIADAELGTGKKPLVLLSDGTIKERAASEGQPLVYDATIGGLRTIASNEILQI